MITFGEWQDRFGELDKCPWRGPRPMEEGDRDLLVGRDDDRERFVQEVLTHQLVVLHGESGVGKSSLLNAGLISDLHDRGYIPIVCRNWTRDANSPEGVEAFVIGKVAGELTKLGLDVDTTTQRSVIEQLDAEYGELVVLVLDQFEELIRHQRVLFRHAIDWIIGLNARHSVHVVISLRSEYLHRLKPLNSAIRPFSMSTVDLEAVTASSDIRDITAGPNGERMSDGISVAAVSSTCGAEMNNVGGLVITEEAVDLVVAEWDNLLHVEFRSGDVGLLHLQGALYSLYARAGEGLVGPEHVAMMINTAGKRGQDMFTLGLGESVSRRLALCEEACRGRGPHDSLDETLIVGTRAAVQRAVTHLSSGGFKLDREAWDLAELALEREFRILQDVPKELTEQAFRKMYSLTSGGDGGADLLSIARAELLTAVGLPLPADLPEGSALRAIGLSVSPWLADPDGLSAGPMLGYSPAEIIVEELRRVAFGLEWLTAAWLIRPTSPTAHSTMLSLIHDGFGDALEEWAAHEDIGPAAALNLLTGAQGEVYEWIHDRYSRYFDGGSNGVTFVNLRWANCRITVRLRNLVFANCDFRGTHFDHCSFEGAVFLNCLLDGATFGDCDIIGPVISTTEAFTDKGMPSFRLSDLDEPTRVALSRYRYDDFLGSRIYSVTSGLAVTTGLNSKSVLLDWDRQSGGLTMYGGRLNSLMVRSNRFVDGGVLALRHIAGSSLDITDQGAAEIDVFGSSIRGLSISRRIGGRSEAGDVELSVRKAVMANTWFDEGLTGSATFDDSQVWQLVNVSDSFRVRITDCTHYGLVNVGDTSRSGPVAPFSEAEVADRTDLVHQARLMAYRREPAMVELEDSDE